MTIRNYTSACTFFLVCIFAMSSTADAQNLKRWCKFAGNLVEEGSELLTPLEAGAELAKGTPEEREFQNALSSARSKGASALIYKWVPYNEIPAVQEVVDSMAVTEVTELSPERMRTALEELANSASQECDDRRLTTFLQS